MDTLLARQADPNHADVEGHTPLVCAVAKGRQRVAAALLAARADPTAGLFHDGMKLGEVSIVW